MSGSHCLAGARALVAVVLLLWGSSCARGSQTVEGSPFGAATPIASSPASPPDATALAVPPDASDADARPVVAASPPESAEVDAEVDGSNQATDAEGDDELVGSDADAPGEPPADGPAIAVPAAGEVAITEVMLTIQDGYGDTAVVASGAAVVLPGATYGLFVRDQATAVQTLVPAAAIVYAYGAGVASSAGIELDEGSAGDLSLWRGDTLLVDVPYGMWDASWLGQSIELATPQSDATDPARWCVAQSPWASGSDDGTPGAPTDCSP
jgi:hypothetical protein